MQMLNFTHVNHLMEVNSAAQMFKVKYMQT